MNYFGLGRFSVFLNTAHNGYSVRRTYSINPARAEERKIAVDLAFFEAEFNCWLVNDR